MTWQEDRSVKTFPRYEWHDGFRSVQMSPDVSLPQFVVIGHRQRQIEVSLSSGNYSRLLADVQFTRSMGYYMIQVTVNAILYSFLRRLTVLGTPDDYSNSLPSTPLTTANLWHPLLPPITTNHHCSHPPPASTTATIHHGGWRQWGTSVVGGNDEWQQMMGPVSGSALCTFSWTFAIGLVLHKW